MLTGNLRHKGESLKTTRLVGGEMFWGMRLEWEIRSDPPTRTEGHTIEFRAEEIGGEEDSRTNYEYLNQGACNSQQRQSHNFPATMMISKLPNRDRNEQYWKPISLFTMTRLTKRTRNYIKQRFPSSNLGQGRLNLVNLAQRFFHTSDREVIMRKAERVLKESDERSR